ncbi:MAG: ABC transporter ATP-binding protein [Desulfobacteraceae bacterium]|nr:ABC transporter ATP-binding protein [Desulfobacteraceae bacterium]
MLEAIGLEKRFTRGIRRKSVFTVSHVSLQVGRGEAVGLVGPSGSGKSTLARMLAQIIRPSAGSVRLDGVDMASVPPVHWGSYQRRIQMIFQDPHLALDPKKTIAWTMREVFQAHGITHSRREADDRINAIFAETGLSLEIRNRLPHEISGGQAQRVVIARALTLNPHYVIADEPTSMLDLSVQAMVFNLLRMLKQQRNLGLVLISHDPAVVTAFCDRVLNIRNGSLVFDVTP